MNPSTIFRPLRIPARPAAVSALLFAAVLGTSVAARAETVTVNGLAYASPATAYLASTSPAYGQEVYAGAFATTIGGAGGNSFLTYCIDIFKDTNFGTVVNDYTEVAPTTLLSSRQVSDLERLAAGFYSQVTDAVTSGAFQVAVWEIVNEKADNPYQVVSGNFRVASNTTDVVNTAQSWLDHLPQSGTYSIQVLSSASHQNLAVFSPTGFILSPVPEPGRWGLLLPGLLGLVALRRRQRHD